MGVINMAHGEFIMMGAYTGYVVQQFVADYTLSIIVALPLAFAVTFAAGVAMERLVIRHLYHRPLETLLATFGISIALQQLAKNIFGTQARPLTSPGWLDGALVINDVIAISYIRIAIFVLALMFLALFLFIMKRTRLGLEVRAVTQNPGMAASHGHQPRPDQHADLRPGLGHRRDRGCGHRALRQGHLRNGRRLHRAKLHDRGRRRRRQHLGHAGGARMIGFLQKGIEWLNPSNTLAAQTYMILFIIIFIQFRPTGIIALKGRAAGDLIHAQRHSLPATLRSCGSCSAAGLFTIAVTVLSEGPGIGVISTIFVKTLGKTLCLCLVAIAMDLVWGYCGILALGISRSSGSAATASACG